MSWNKVLRAGAIGVSTLMAAGTVAVVGAGSASAANVGRVSVTPVSGASGTLFTMTTEAPCPVSSANRINVQLSGPNISGSLVVLPTTTIGFSTTNPITTGLGNSIRNEANLAGVSALNGTYTLKVNCVTFTGSVIDNFSTTLEFTGTDVDNATYVAEPAPAVSTSTTVSGTPAPGTLLAGSLVDLSATVTPAQGAANAVTGNVQFKANGVGLGAPRPVVNGVATLDDQNLPSGTVDVTAEYAGATTAFAVYGASTSSAITYDVVSADATATGLIAAQTAEQKKDQKVQLSAAVTNVGAPPSFGTPVGSVQFTADGAPVGTVALDGAGEASIEYVQDPALAPGATANVLFEAVYVPTGGFTGSQNSLNFSLIAPNVVNEGNPSNVGGNGQEATIEFPAGTFQPNEPVEAVTVFSTPIVLCDSDAGTPEPSCVSANADGSFTFTFTVPAGLAAGPHTILVEGSATGPVVYLIVVGDSESQEISVEVPAGALTISVVGDAKVQLKDTALNAGGTAIESRYAAAPAPGEGPGNRIDTTRVVDTRAGDVGWTATGQLGDFQLDGTGATSIEGDNLGWEPFVVSQLTGQAVVAGSVVSPANALGLGDPLGNPNNGLANGPRTLASAPSNGGLGTADLAANLNLKAPTSTVAGTHIATLTLTVA